MSICQLGLTEKIKTTRVTVDVTEKHPLIVLANKLDWETLADTMLPDLKKTTTKLFWWRGRKLKLRVHLGVYLLQQLLNQSDRNIERQIKDNVVYQVFCGQSVLEDWHCPDHTKIETFRSRLSPETQCKLANSIAQLAVKHGYADPADIDIDSTVQTPDMQYPADSNLLVKCAVLAKRVKALCEKLIPEKVTTLPSLDLKAVKGLAKHYFFSKSIKNKEKRESTHKKSLHQLWETVSCAVFPLVNVAKLLTEPFIMENLPKREKTLLDQFTRKAGTLLSGLFEKQQGQTSTEEKVYSFFRDAVHCFNKNKLRKGCEFGRQFQIGRIAGNFLFSIPNTSLHMPDPASFKPMLIEHIHTFQTPIESVGTDKGYYSKANEQLALDWKINTIAIQRPQRKLIDAPDNPISDEALELMVNRRSGIEPLIGHLKQHWQMGRSRMKSDTTTESSGFAALLSFNLRQLMRYASGQANLVTE